MTETILCGTPKRASTVQRRVRSRESYDLVRSIKRTYNEICFFRANSCSPRITNIVSVVERFVRKPLCCSVRNSTMSGRNPPSCCTLTFLSPFRDNIKTETKDMSLDTAQFCDIGSRVGWVSALQVLSTRLLH